MITGAIKSQVDQIGNAFWSGGVGDAHAYGVNAALTAIKRSAVA